MEGYQRRLFRGFVLSWQPGQGDYLCGFGRPEDPESRFALCRDVLCTGGGTGTELPFGGPPILLQQPSKSFNLAQALQGRPAPHYILWAGSTSPGTLGQMVDEGTTCGTLGRPDTTLDTGTIITELLPRYL